MEIKLENLSFTYMKGSPYEKNALKNINLTINSGEFVGIIGPSGSGKTTLVQHFNGLLLPTNGKVYIDGIATDSKEFRSKRKSIGFVFQYPEYQLFEETVYLDIAFGPKNHGYTQTEIEKSVRKAATLLELDDEILSKSPFELSGGQKRRAAIAGVLATEPDILILDEPAAGLDPHSREELYKIIKLYRNNAKTIIFVSHNMEDVAKLCTRILAVNQHEIVMDGTPMEIFTNTKKLNEYSLDTPDITKLYHQLSQHLPDFKQRSLMIEDVKDHIIEYWRKKNVK